MPWFVLIIAYEVAQRGKANALAARDIHIPQDHGHVGPGLNWPVEVRW